ncbi:MAG: carboxypeptidase-like regulatory domain-containing protein [Candidatus Saccharicenans sp.]|nr:carboxypeptidase-like regulatory domain-containing protein [Candidatus Saccharicenans sp.]
MLTLRIFKSRLFVTLVVSAFTLLILPMEGFSRTDKPLRGGTLTGFIYASDMKTPVQNAVVKLRNVDNGQEFASAPTDATGLYKIEKLKEGKYVLGITAPDGDYNFGYVVSVKEGEVGKLSLALMRGEVAPMDQGSEGYPKEKPSFFWTPVGIAVLMVLTTGALYGAFKLMEGKEEASPSKK